MGAFRERSLSLVGLVDVPAERGAERWMGRLAAPSLKQAKATLLTLWRQRLGMCALRGHARLMLARAHQLYLRPERRGGGRGAGGLRAAMGVPVGAGPEGCVSEFSCEADRACVRLTVGGLGVQGWQGRGRAVRGDGPGRAWVAREARARG